MSRFRLFQKRDDRAITLRQQAEDLFAQLRAISTNAASTGTPLRGQHSQRQGGPGHEFWQYRDFQGGDHSRTIDWKQSAKTDRVLIRQKEKEAQKKISLWLQNDPGMQFGSIRHALTKYECGAIIALVAAMLGIEHHDPVTLSGVGSVSLDDLTHILGSAEYQPNIDDLSGHEIFLIGDFLEPDHFFEPIPPHKTVHVVQIFDPAELDLPYTGRTVFEHPAGIDHEQILNVTAIRDTYREKLDHHIDDIRQYCRARNWSYSLFRSDQNLLPPLIDLLLHGEAAP